jgi:6-phosphogluconate dehydrogenase
MPWLDLGPASPHRWLASPIPSEFLAEDVRWLTLVRLRVQMGEFVAALERPRRIIILVQAGAAVDATIAGLTRFLEPGDLIVDGGNEWYPNTIRRGRELAEKGILFMGMGVSGGEVRRVASRHGVTVAYSREWLAALFPAAHSC